MESSKSYKEGGSGRLLLGAGLLIVGLQSMVQ